jgi:hypothetical protein
MKSFRIFALATLLITMLAAALYSRPMPSWSYRKLLDTSDLVAVATPIATKDTDEQLKRSGRLTLVGVETRFEITAVLKGDKTLMTLVLHHYRESKHDKPIIDGPNLVGFDPSKKETYLLFLQIEKDGRYAPLYQDDPAIRSVQKLHDDVPAPRFTPNSEVKDPYTGKIYHTSPDGRIIDP